MAKITQYIRKHRFIQILLFLAALILSYFAGYCTRRLHDYRTQQAVYDQLSLAIQQNRQILTRESAEDLVELPQMEPEATPEEEIDVIAEFLAIGDNQEKYGECLAGIPDFSVLRGINQDIIAYMYLPDSVIDYPVLQSEDNGYYLEHNLDGSMGYPGCLYIENMNHADFTDPATVIYGHHLFTGGMFSDLEQFLDPVYMDSHRYYFIYRPNEIQIYEVVLAAKYNNEHLLVSCYTKVEENLYQFNGFSGGEGKLIYDRIQAFGLEGNYYTEHAPTEDDNMIFWSTCLPARNRRVIIGARRITAENIGELTG